MNLSNPDLRQVLGAFVNVPSNDEGLIEAVLERMRQDFEATKGPLIPWSAFNLAVDAGRPLPQWIIGHLREVSKKIHESASQSMDQKLGREAEVMGRALGFGQGKAGTTPAARESARMHRDFQVAVRVVVEMQLGANKDAAIYAVAKNKDASIRAGANQVALSEATVWRAFKRYGPEAEEHLRRCIADAER